MVNVQRLRDKITRDFPGAKFSEVDGTMVVHMDEPDAVEVERRVQEVRGGLMIEDDCPLCQDLARNKPEVVLYDKDSILCLGQDSVTGFPVKATA